MPKLTKYKLITDAPPTNGIYIFGSHWLSREDVRVLLKELEAKTQEWCEDIVDDDFSYPYGA